MTNIKVFCIAIEETGHEIAYPILGILTEEKMKMIFHEAICDNINGINA